MTLTINSRRTAHFHPSDLHALARVITDATTGIVDLVEDVHMRVAPRRLLGPAGKIAPFTYQTIRGAARLIGGGATISLAQIGELLEQRDDSPQRQAVLSILNGLWGDYLHETNSPLALPMSFTFGEGAPRGKIAVLVHGLCMNDSGWQRSGEKGPSAHAGTSVISGVHDHGAALARDLDYSPVYLNYNSGLHISSNGRALAIMLEALVDVWPVPVEELVIIGHSMGGLVTRSACYYGETAGHAWLDPLRATIFLGTPHHGVPLERQGNLLNILIDSMPFVAPFGRLGRRRSAGITDLRYSNLVDEDWAGRDRFAQGPDRRCHVPPPAGVRAYAVAAALGNRADSAAARLLGDGLVPLDSALGRHPSADRCLGFDDSNSWIGYGMNHADLLGRAEVYERMANWLA